ncbi:MAG: T9SS type A sorting domain-containing protein [Lewinellaceae bacterium]|nr:T9SS type A sorting domain-containing protein [Saprospiraceae bacterium]MCB9345224.1 T9SS type A sorting domain-containing protein [Lewinellaceae bacterium]
MIKQLLTALLLFSSFSVNAQLVPCRPKICMVDYAYHDDNFPNADMMRIKAAKPDILIDNTPGGYWGQINGGVGCLPKEYTPLGIQVFSYIPGGYEGTKYQSFIDNLDTNLMRVNLIAADSATGVFLDEVSTFPDAASKAYLTAIYQECQNLGLKLIFNTGVDTFDSWLMDHCDYLMSDELYDGNRVPTSFEAPFIDRMLVIANSVTTAADAQHITTGAYQHGFGFSYACETYILLPTWMEDYLIQSVLPTPMPPVITQGGNALESSETTGNQWYEVGLGEIPGEVGQSFEPLANGSYYVVVTNDLNCSSDPSNVINFTLSRLRDVETLSAIQVFPNPASEFVSVSADINQLPITYQVYDQYGRLCVAGTIDFEGQLLPLNELSNGLYLIKLNSEFGSVARKLVVEK